MKKMVIMVVGMLMASSVGAQYNQHLTPYQQCEIAKQKLINALSKEFDMKCMSQSHHCKNLKKSMLDAGTMEEINKAANSYTQQCAIKTTDCNNLKNQIAANKKNSCHHSPTCEQQLKQMQQYATKTIERQMAQINSLSRKYQGLIGLCNKNKIIIPMDLR